MVDWMQTHPALTYQAPVCEALVEKDLLVCSVLISRFKHLFDANERLAVSQCLSQIFSNQMCSYSNTAIGFRLGRSPDAFKTPHLLTTFEEDPGHHHHRLNMLKASVLWWQCPQKRGERKPLILRLLCRLIRTKGGRAGKATLDNNPHSHRRWMGNNTSPSTVNNSPLASISDSYG